MELNAENFTLDEIYHILSLVTVADYRRDTLGGVNIHRFDVEWGEDIEYGDINVTVPAGEHRLILDAHTDEWTAYVGPDGKEQQ